MKVDVDNPELIIQTLLNYLVTTDRTLEREATLTVATMHDDGMGITPIEKETDVIPEYSKTIKNLMKQNEKQRKWLDEKNAEIHCLNGKLADRRQQASNHYEQNHDLIKAQRQLCDDINAYIQDAKMILCRTTKPIQEQVSLNCCLMNMEKTIAVFRTYQTSKSLPEVPVGEPVQKSCSGGLPGFEQECETDAGG